MGVFNDDISLILAKAKFNGMLPDVNDAEVGFLRAIASNMFSSDATLSLSKDALALRKLENSATLDREKSQVNSLIAYQDSTQFIENWANQTAWSSSTAFQVSGNKAYGAAVGQTGNSGANHSFALASNENMRAVFNVQTKIGGSGGVIVGVSSDAAGGAFTSGGTTTRGLYFNISSGSVTGFNNGGVGASQFSLTGTQNWIVTLTVDETYITITAGLLGNTAIEIRDKWTRAGFNVNNLVVFNSDTAALTGCSVGLIGAKKSISTITPRTGIEDIYRTVTWTTIGTAKIRVALPLNYDSRKPSPVALLFHGNGSDETHWVTNSAGQAVADAFTNAGYITVSAGYTVSNTTWGAQGSLDAYYEAYKYVRDHFSIGPVVFYANSMGGIESLLTLTERRIPAAAWIGTVPTASLKSSYDNAIFKTTVAAAYGIAGDGSDYATKTLDHDPCLKQGSAFRGIPMYALVATDDASIPYLENWEVFKPIIEPFAAEVVTNYVTGGHGTTAISSNTANYVAFANKHIAL